MLNLYLEFVILYIFIQKIEKKQLFTKKNDLLTDQIIEN